MYQASYNEGGIPLNNRWWEFYLVRYFVGTVFGTLVTLYLYSNNTAFSKFYKLQVSLKDFTSSHIILFGLLGLAFCYIASTPILVLHATRSSIFKPHKFNKKPTIIGIIVLILVTVALYWVTKNNLEWFFLIFIFLVQVILLVLALYKGNILDFYVKLINKRAASSSTIVSIPTTNPEVIKEYTESYRHLREHGNAFSIVLMEFIFGIILYFMKDIQEVVVTMIIWIIPSSFVWFIGSYLESKINKI